MARGPRSAVQAGLATALAAAVALALLTAASAAFLGDAMVDFRGVGNVGLAYTSANFNDAVCASVDGAMNPAFFNFSTVEGAVHFGVYPGAPACGSVSFHSTRGCAGAPSATYLRAPATTMRLFVAEMPASVRCETGCDGDCGTAARCIVRDGQDQCVCPGSQVYDANDGQCRAA